jgi:UDP-N-acetylmuramyl pentapeptide phosphotransferase/UDP-N-acetylglucosamine-1-phosphate transferase
MKNKEMTDADLIIGVTSTILLCVLAAIGCIMFFGNEEYFAAFVCFLIMYSLLTFLKHLRNEYTK